MLSSSAVLVIGTAIVRRSRCPGAVSGAASRASRRPPISTASWRRRCCGATSIARRSATTCSTKSSRSRCSDPAGSLSPGCATSTRGTCATAFTSAARLKINGVPIGESRSPRLRGALDQERRGPPQVPHRARSEARAGGQAPGDERALDQRAALHLRVLLHGLQVRARQLLPRRQGNARRPRSPEDRLPAVQAVQRRPTEDARSGSGSGTKDTTEDAKDAKDAEGRRSRKRRSPTSDRPKSRRRRRRPTRTSIAR